jgi:uncharacterized membrane protein YgcG
MNATNLKWILLVLLAGLFSCSEKTTTMEQSVFDHADLLTQSSEDSINSLIEDLDKSVGSQVAVLTVDTLNGVNINEFSIREAEKLSLGREKEKDGLLITLSMKDKKIRIEVGYGLENIIKDEIANQIIGTVMLPEFKNGKFGQGIYNAVDTIKILIESNKALIGKMQ